MSEPTHHTRDAEQGMHPAKSGHNRRHARPRAVLCGFLALLCCLAIAGAHARAYARAAGASETLTLSGQVCARATNAPVSGALVGAQGHWATAGRDGTYTLTLRPASRLPMRAAAPGFQSTDVITMYNPAGGVLSGQLAFSFCKDNGLVDAYRSADGTVRLTSFPQQQSAASHTITISGTSTVALESDPALELPTGMVTLLSLHRHGNAISIDVPLTGGKGRYVLEINAAAGFALIKLPIFVGTGFTPPPAPAAFAPDPKNATTAQLRTATLDAINHLRAQAKLPSLAVDAHLTSAAQGHSDDMAAHNFVGHIGSNGSRPDQRVHAAGVQYTETAEDVGSGDSVQSVIEGLMDSPAHRWAILGTFRIVGIGIAHAHGDLLMTLDFVR